MEAVLNAQNLMPAKISVRENASPTEAKGTDNRFIKLLKQQQELMRQPEQLNNQKVNVSQAEEGTVREPKKETEKFVEEEPEDSVQQEALQQAVLQQAAIQMTENLSVPSAEPEMKENPVVLVEAVGEIVPDTGEIKNSPETVPLLVSENMEEAKETENLPQAEIFVSQQTTKLPETPKTEAVKPQEEKPEVKEEIPKAESKAVETAVKTPETKTETLRADAEIPKAEENTALVNAEEIEGKTEVSKQSEEAQTLFQAQEESEKEKIQQEISKEGSKEKTVNPTDGKTEKHQEEKAESTETSIFSAVKPTGEEKTETNAHSQKQENRNTNARIDIKKEILGVSDLGNSGQETIHSAGSFRLFDNQPSFLNSKAGEIPLKTTPETLPTDLGKTLAAKLPGSTAGTLTVELEPASLGKLTIRLIYEGDRAAVSIMASNPKTMEILNQKISEIAAILEEKTGQETIIYTQPPQQNEDEFEQRQGGGQNGREESQNKRQKENQPSDSFAQQLRLGLI